MSHEILLDEYEYHKAQMDLNLTYYITNQLYLELIVSQLRIQTWSSLI